MNSGKVRHIRRPRSLGMALLLAAVMGSVSVGASAAVPNAAVPNAAAPNAAAPSVAGPAAAASGAAAPNATVWNATVRSAAVPAATVGVGKPVLGSAPQLSGPFAVGSTVRVTPGTWTGAAPITFSYVFQSCTAGAASCTTAPGLFASGPRPQLLLVAAAAGRWLRVKVTATNPSGKTTVTTPLSGPVTAYPATAAPKVELINGTPAATSWSSRSTFQFQATGTGVTARCRLDSQAATTCPANAKPSYGNLAPGTHTFTVTATNAYGSASAAYTWQVVALPGPTDCPGCYHPAVGSTWQWQLNPDTGASGINTSVVADMYEIDGFANDAATVATLHASAGTHTARRGVTCYWSAGTSEDWRPDATAYDPMLLGNAYSGFADERWVDIRQLPSLAPILTARMDMCRAKGFDAIEFDNMDSWFADNKTGLNLTQEDATAFVVWLAQQAHLRGLSMALKSVVELVPAVRRHVDFSVVEQCFEFQECTRSSANTGGAYGYDMMTELGKPVFEAEYRTYSATSNVCAQANALGFGTIYKHVALDSYRISCNG